MVLVGPVCTPKVIKTSSAELELKSTFGCALNASFFLSTPLSVVNPLVSRLFGSSE